jgi:hypothetical protein
MNRYIMIRRLRGPAFLLLVGVLALLNQANILGWSKSWPLFLILAGVLLLAERAALAADGGYPRGPYSGSYPASAPCSDPPAPSAATGIPPYPGQPTAIVPVRPDDLMKENEGGQS